MQALDNGKTRLSEEWDALVASHPNGWISMTSDWEKIICDTFPSMISRPIVLKRNTAVVAGVPLYETRTFFHGRRFESIPFATISNPLWNSEDEAKTVLQEIDQLLKETGTKHIRLTVSTDSEPSWLNGYFPEKKYLIHEINLSLPIEELFHKFHRSCIQQQIRKVEKYNLSFSEFQSMEELPVFYSLYIKTRRRLGLPAIPKAFFKNCAKWLLDKKNVHFFSTSYEGCPVAAFMAFTYQNRFSADALGWDHNAHKTEPVISLFWSAIKWAKENGYTIFDFGRTAPDNKSLIEFKDRWGSTRREMHIYSKMPPRNYPSPDRLRNLARFGLSKMPLPLYEYLSKKFYLSLH